MLATNKPMPDILIDRTGATVAVLDSARMLVPAPGLKGRFSVAKWLLANGEETSPADAAKRRGWSCDETRCTATVQGKSLAYVQKEGEAFSCTGIDILIASYPLRHTCPSIPLRIDRFDLWKYGAHALKIDGASVLTTTARGEAGERPWVIAPEPRKDKYKKP